MPKMTFSSDNKPAGQDNFPRLKLDQDEIARISVFEAPDVAFVHNLRAPKIVNGEVKYVTVQTKNGPDLQMDFDFVSNPICLGDFDVVKERGVDVKNCPACAAVQDAPDMFQKPKRRYAMHVFQYTTNGTSKPTKNFQGSVKIWSFTDQKFAEIVDLADEAPGSDIANVDLILGPCENKMFQKYKMIASTQVKKNESEASQESFAEIVADNKVDNLESFLGRPMKKDWMDDKIVEVKKRWSQANGLKDETSGDGLVSAEPNLDAGLSGLLDSTPASVKPVAQSNAGKSDSSPVDFDDLLKDL